MKTRALSATLFVLAACAMEASAAPNPAPAAKSQPAIAQSPDSGQAGVVDDAHLSAPAQQLAQQLGMSKQMERLAFLRASDRPSSPEALLVRQDLSETLLVSRLEFSTVINRIEREEAKAAEVHAALEERRDRAVRLNSYANLVSGGISGIVGGALDLGSVNHLAPHTIDTVEGVIQSGLSGYALHQQHGDRRFEQGFPNILAAVFRSTGGRPAEFPPSVWNYLTSSPDGKAESRKDRLVDRWLRLGLCLIHKGHRVAREERITHLTGTHVEVRRVRIDLLEDRMAMLRDLRSVLTMVDDLMLELSRFVKGSVAQ